MPYTTLLPHCCLTMSIYSSDFTEALSGAAVHVRFSCITAISWLVYSIGILRFHVWYFPTHWITFLQFHSSRSAVKDTISLIRPGKRPPKWHFWLSTCNAMSGVNQLEKTTCGSHPALLMYPVNMRHEGLFILRLIRNYIWLESLSLKHR